MYIKTVTFEVLAEAKETFSEKIRKDIASMKTFEGCLQSECWINEKASVDFQLVSKWQEKKHFQAWLKRPEHLQNTVKLIVQKRRKRKTFRSNKQEWTRLFLI